MVGKKIVIACIGALVAAACMPFCAFADDGGVQLRAQTIAQADENASQGQEPLAGPEVAEIEDGLYALSLAALPDASLSVKKASIKAGANVLLAADTGSNGQKFVIKNVSGGYVRIGAALGETVVSVRNGSKKNGANVAMAKYTGTAAQLWRPEVSGEGVRFVNKKSGKALAIAKKRVGANVCQSGAQAPSKQTWAIEDATINLQDRQSFLNAINAASSAGSVELSNPVEGYTVNKKKWKELVAATRACNSRFNIRYIMLDCSTGMTVSCNPDTSWHAASTIKGLYATYLFEDCLETGKLTKNQVNPLMQRTVGNSENDAYFALRARFGTQSGFNAWLKEVGIGPKGVWTNYSPRTLAKAWTRMLAYANSDGKYVGYWKKTFNHGYRSAVRMALSSTRTVYSKPGWNGGYDGSATRYHDGSLVIDDEGRNYLICFMSTGHPDRDKAACMRLVKALDAVHMDMPATR